MTTPGSTILNIGAAGGQNHYKLDYSTAAGAGVTSRTQAQLTTFELANIFTQTADGVWCAMRSDVDVDPIAANGYPRTELREMATDGVTLRAFNPNTGDHWASVIFKVIHLPPVKPSVVVLQLHDATDDIIEIAVQPRSDYASTGKVELVCRINGTSVGIPKLSADYPLGEVSRIKIRVGAVAGGNVGWEAYYNNMSIPAVKSTDAGMPALDTPGGTLFPASGLYPSGSLYPNSTAACYFKSGCYLQTKHTSSGTGGLETNVNEYGEVWFRELQTAHSGETAPQQLVYGADASGGIFNVRWGTKVEAVNTAGTPFTATPPLPAGLDGGDMVYAVVRARRTGGTSPVSTPGATTPPLGWARLVNFSTNTGAPADLVSHSQRLQLWAAPWVSGMAAPGITYSATTATDIVSAQCFAIAGGKLGAAVTELIDQIPAGMTYGAASATVVGPTAALPANAQAGALALALLTHEFNVLPGEVVSTPSGDGLTWNEGGEGVGSTVAFQAWANDWALVPTSQAITGKQAAAKVTSGKSASVLLTLAPARKTATGLMAASA